jgi:hypothetical protein
MHQPYADPFALFGSLDLDLGDDRPTWPPPGTAQLVVEDKFEPLFTSATWTITATVDGDVIAKSKESGRAHTAPFIKRWTRQLIRTRYERLRQLGVDAEAEYVKLGGDLEDLQP